MINTEERGTLTFCHAAMLLILVFRLVCIMNGEWIIGCRVAWIWDYLGRVGDSSEVTGRNFFSGVAGIELSFDLMSYKTSQTSLVTSATGEIFNQGSWNATRGTRTIRWVGWSCWTWLQLLFACGNSRVFRVCIIQILLWATRTSRVGQGLSHDTLINTSPHWMLAYLLSNRNAAGLLF